MWSSRTGARISALRCTIQPRLLRAFCATDYTVGGSAARIGRRSVAVDRLLRSLGSKRGAFLTAWNPGARQRPVGLNRRADLALQEWLQRVRAEPGFGCGRGWHEAHWLIAADPRRVAVLGRRFRQVGMVVVQCGQKARLHFFSLAVAIRLVDRALAWRPPAMRQPARSTVSLPLQSGAPRDRCSQAAGRT